MPTSVPATKVRSVCFTLFNYEPLLERLRDYARIECEYMIFGYEVCPETNRPHLQGYIYWKNPRAYPNKFLRKLFPGIHDEVAMGSPAQNRDYCLKTRPGDVPNIQFEEFGDIPTQGSRTDWKYAMTQLTEGDELLNVLEVQPHLIPCIRALERVKQLAQKPRPICKPDVYVLVGQPGSGKTRWAYDNYPDLYSKPNGQWWDGYQGQETILLDDFYGDVEYSLLLKVCDRYPLQVPVKGGFTQANWKRIIITSNHNPQQWYPGHFDLSAFNRRVNNFYIDSIPKNANEEEYAQEGQSLQETQVRTTPDCAP